MSNHLCTVAVISPDRKIHKEVAAALNGNPKIQKLWMSAEYPDPVSLAEIPKAPGGCVLFLDFSDKIRAKAVAAELENFYPMAHTVALHSATQSQDLIDLMQLGIREVVRLPVQGSDVIAVFSRVGLRLKAPSNTGEEGGHLYAFFPAKPGAGATTFALHGAAAAARLANRATLLLDFDFRLGMTSFLFKLSADHSVVDAIASREELDADLWDRIVCRRGMLDILGSAPVNLTFANPEHGAVALLDFARKAYPTTCVDLPGEMREYEIETINRAKECFLVTTPDLGALHMAKRKAEMLYSLGLQAKVSVIMNQIESRRCMPVKDVEAILQLPVRFMAPLAKREIAEATRSGTALKAPSPFVAQIEAIAHRMGTGAASSAGSKARRFIEMFSVSSVRDRAAG